MTNDFSRFRLTVTVSRDGESVEVFKGALSREDGVQTKIQKEIALSSEGMGNVVVGVVAAKKSRNSFRGYVTLLLGGDAYVNWSFCCLPGNSQSMRARVEYSIVEIMLTNDLDKELPD